MKKTLLIVIVVIVAITVVLGTNPPTFQEIENAIESVKSTSYDLTKDISTITLIYFTIIDFSKHADGIEVEFYLRMNEYGQESGESGWVYRSWIQENIPSIGEYRSYIREEIVPVTPADWHKWDTGPTTPENTDYWEMYRACEKAIYPVKELIEFDRSEEEEWGFFERVFNNIKLGVLTIKTVISAVIVTLVDTIELVWEVISAGFKIIGVAS